ncbi:hypothetical protein A0J48_003070 [Sphaerospermopsis aphanizomenoides BCCUSP55]|uniref:hypothetical protein n=1 Tax=Sphaerospermopsis aphanizomenoides TaxID=459663 RepID=UPI001905AD7C|nr:hypothetical protein [Sphaerospermopsis aphanizomenoides]MBK1986535.1 hypothetical protein [Sphaerospermopsis aphanizomenoides BCCUSP55]
MMKLSRLLQLVVGSAAATSIVASSAYPAHALDLGSYTDGGLINASEAFTTTGKLLSGYYTIKGIKATINGQTMRGMVAQNSGDETQFRKKRYIPGSVRRTKERRKKS